MKGLYNNQNRKSGGYKKSNILMSQKETLPLSLPCKELRHSDCDGYVTFMPKLKGYMCNCECHKLSQPSKGKGNV